MGTLCRITYAASSRGAREFREAALRWVADFEARYSRFLPDSLICRINQSAGRESVKIDPETERIFALCHEAHFLTHGVFDPTALPLIELWDWRANLPAVPTEAEIEAARAKVGWAKVQRGKGRIFLPQEGMGLDLGGIGKEYAVDRVVQLALQHGIASVLVDFGQDVFAYGEPADGRKTWHIGLEDPKQPGKCWAGLAVTNQAVATSGDYFRRFELNGRRYGHILDVRTGKPVANGCRSVSVIAPTCTAAGILSTAIFVLGPAEGLRLVDAYYQAEGCIITENSKIPSRRFYEHVAS
ncbi:MAG: FAD:protein FMN transferase [Verrucomicrobia bacterium]|nr:FAD:protein FMN transferase [Verrucomicrobiota bacterium]